jgi:hypothetical protein
MIRDDNRYILLSKSFLVRKFQRWGSEEFKWNLGGRLYAQSTGGVTWQNLSKTERSTILIDGQETVELDYGSLHPSILYDRMGAVKPDDMYRVSVDRRTVPRKLVKLMMLIMLNAKTKSGALIAFRQEAKEKYPDRNSLGWINKANRIQSAVLKRHSPIREHFCTDIGIRLQFLDSELTISILKHFYDKGVVVLPVHDSYIIQSQYRAELRQVMTEKYRDMFGGTPVIK